MYAGRMNMKVTVTLMSVVYDRHRFVSLVDQSVFSPLRRQWTFIFVYSLENFQKKTFILVFNKMVAVEMTTAIHSCICCFISNY